MRQLALLLLISVTGCQCFQPVSEDRDGGIVSDAGFDAGLPGLPECTRANDCAPVMPPRDCWFAVAPARSCFDGRCVYDCEGVRTCSTHRGSCLSCDGGVPNCNAATCGAISNGDMGRLYRSCGPGTPDLLGTFQVRYRTGATCNFKVFFGDGGVFGALDLLGEDTTGSAEVTEEPGITCTVRPLATALNRVELGCARCLYLLEWP